MNDSKISLEVLILNDLLNMEAIDEEIYGEALKMITKNKEIELEVERSE